MKKILNKSAALTILLTILLLSRIDAESLPATAADWQRPFKQCWSFEPENFFSEKTASDNAKVFSLSSMGKVLSVDGTSGKTLWEIELGGESVSKIVSDEKNIFLINRAGRTSSATEETGDKTDLRDDTIDKDAKVPVGGDQDPGPKTNVTLRSIDSETGVTNWQKILAENLYVDLYIFERNLLLITKNGGVIFFEKDTGKIFLEIDLKKEISAAVIVSGKISIATIDAILVLSAADGTILKEFPTREAPQAFLFDEDRLFWSDRKGVLYASRINSADIVWKRRLGAGITSITETPSGIFVSSIDNFIYFLNKATGKIIWKRRLAARVSEKPFIRENVAVIFPFGESTALFLELNKGKIVNSITLSDANYFSGKPFFIGELLVFPTLRGFYAFGSDCPPMEKTGV